MSQVFIIAEAGVNHNGDLAQAKKLIQAAAKAGADAVKFQTFRADALVTKEAGKAKYQATNTGVDDGAYGMLKALELPAEVHQELIDVCRDHSILFMSTPCDEDSLRFLHELKVAPIKVASGELNNIPYLRAIGSFGKEVILSTGMGTLEEVKTAVATLVAAGTPKDLITVLHCHTDYPSQMRDLNLRAMNTIEQALQIKVGYSDHSLGIHASIAAVALGAKVIEKHYTLDRNLPGPDHSASLLPAELAEMVRCIRDVEQALGSGEKKPTAIEEEHKPIVRRSIVTTVAIGAGEILSAENLSLKRPGTGMTPSEWDHVLGKKAVRDLSADTLLRPSDFE